MCYSDFFFQFLSAINFIEREIKFSFSVVFLYFSFYHILLCLYINSKCLFNFLILSSTAAKVFLHVDVLLNKDQRVPEFLFLSFPFQKLALRLFYSNLNLNYFQLIAFMCIGTVPFSALNPNGYTYRSYNEKNGPISVLKI